MMMLLGDTNVLTYLAALTGITAETDRQTDRMVITYTAHEWRRVIKTVPMSVEAVQ